MRLELSHMSRHGFVDVGLYIYIMMYDGCHVYISYQLRAYGTDVSCNDTAVSMTSVGCEDVGINGYLKADSSRTCVHSETLCAIRLRFKTGDRKRFLLAGQNCIFCDAFRVNLPTGLSAK